MKKIVGVLRPFDLQQNFYVYEDGNKIDAATPTVDQINDTVFAFVEAHDVHQMDLAGPKQYARGISKKYQKAEMTKYNANTMIINII